MKSELVESLNEIRANRTFCMSLGVQSVYCPIARLCFLFVGSLKGHQNRETARRWRLCSQHSLARERRRRNFSFYSLIRFVHSASAALIFIFIVCFASISIPFPCCSMLLVLY